MNDVRHYRNLKDPDATKDYSEKLEVIKKRRLMINQLNDKYGAGAKLFLDILDKFRDDPHHLMTQPNKKVQKLIRDTLEKYLKEVTTQPFVFRN